MPTHTPHSFKLAATALAISSFLAACGGGGSASAPGDTTAPTVTIEDNVSEATANGNVTFTFRFNEAVSGFTESDVTVTGGTKGAFNMAPDNLSATLVVTPAAESTGSVQVSVAAGTFTDTAGNRNTAAVSADQAFNTVTPTPGLIANGNFSSGTTGWTGNAANVVTEGGNSYNFADVAQATDPWNVNLSYGLSIPTQGVQYKLTFKASSNRTRALKAGIGLSGAPYTNDVRDVTLTTTPQTFELTLTSNFASENSRVLFDMGHDTGHVVIDDVVLEVISAVAAPTAAAPTPPARNAADVKSIFSDTYTNLNVAEWGPNWGDYSARIESGIVAGNNYKIINIAANQTFAGISFPASKFDASSFTHFSVDYWIADPAPTGQVINIKLSNHDGNAETSAIQHTVTSITTGSWQTLRIPLSSFVAASDPANLSRNAIAQVVISAARADVSQPIRIYFDNMYFYK